MGKRLSEDEIKWILSVESSDAQQNIRKLTKENKELDQQNKQYVKTMEKLVAQGKKESTEYKNLKKAMQDNKAQMDKNKQSVNALTDRMSVNQLTMAQLRKRAKDLQRQLDNTSKATHPEQYKKLDNQLRQTRMRMDELGTSGKKMGSFFNGGMMKKGAILAASALFLKAMKDGIVKIKEFEQANADLAAVLGTTRSKIGLLTEDALRLGAKTEYTASQVSNLQLELAKLGFDQKQIRNMTEPILLFSTATSADLPAAAKLAGAALRSFELDSTQTERAVSAMAVATTKSALDFSFLESAMSTIAPVARSFGFTIEDTVALLGTLANAGFDASTAATSTRNILLNLADSSGKLAKALGRPVNSMEDLVPALVELRNKGVDLAGALELTDKRSVAAFNTFLSGAENLSQLKEAVTDAGGELKKMQQEKISTLEGSTKMLSSAWEGLMLAFSKSAGFLKSAVDFFTSLISVTTELVKPQEDLTAKLEEQVSKIADLEVNTVKLANRYEELKSKTNLTKAEQVELNKIITSLRDNVPGLEVEFDKYGNVLSINTDRVWAFIEAEKARLAIMNKDAIKQKTKELERYRTELDKVNIQLQTNTRTQYSGGGMHGGSVVKNVPLTPEEVTARQNEKQTLLQDIQKAEGALEYLTGDSYIKQIEIQKQQLAKRNEFNAMTKVQLEEYIKLYADTKDKFVDIAQSMYKQKFGSGGDGGGTEGKENKVKAALEHQIKELENAYKQRQLQIDENTNGEWSTEQERQTLLLTAERDYLEKRMKLFSGFSSSYATLNTEVNGKLLDDKKKYNANQEKLDKDQITVLEKARAKDLAVEEYTTKQIRNTYKQQLADKQISQEEYNMLSLTLDQNSAEVRLAIEERFLSDINDLELKNGNLKVEAVEKANKQLLDAEGKAVDARAAIQLKLDDLLKDFKGQFKLTTVDEDLQAQLKVLDDVYKARKELALKNNLDTTQLDAAYLSAREQLIQESESRINQIRSKYGLLTLQDEYNLELQQLNTHLQQEYLTQEEYEKAVQNLKRDSAKKQFDYYKELFSGAFESLQQAELDMVDAKYDAQIEAAQGNAEEVERLENEKAQKKLDIEKKYADVNFAIKASQIIADTSVAIMRAFADLGPIGGAVAAALLGVTGLAQLASANAERKKIKSMTLSGKSSGSATGARVATGRESGGKIDIIREQDGKFFPAADYNPNARGFIDKPTVIVGEGAHGHSKEWVASNAAVENETVAPILQLLDKHQQAGDIATVDMNHVLRQHMAAGYVTGGSISKPLSPKEPSTPSAATQSNSDEVLDRLTNVLSSIEKNGIPADVLLSDLERKTKLRNQARSIGSK